MKVEVTEGMVEWAMNGYQQRDGESTVSSQRMKDALAIVFAHPDFRNQLRDMVLAAVPGEERPVTHGGAEESYAAAFNDCRAETLANIERWEKGEG